MKIPDYNVELREILGAPPVNNADSQLQAAANRCQTKATSVNSVNVCRNGARYSFNLARGDHMSLMFLNT